MSGNCASIEVMTDNSGRFWQRQRGMSETIQIGRAFIAQVSG